MSGPLVVGLVHTVPGLAGTFEQLLVGADPEVRTLHAADPWLLASAVERGVDGEVTNRVASHAAHLAATGAVAVLLTCSSLGETVAAASARAGVPVLRVDAPMAEEAVAEAARAGRAAGRRGRVAVLATLPSTLGPTGRLVEQAAARSRTDVDVDVSVVDGAAAARSSGRQDRHDTLVREAVAAALQGSDVVVLAQASMAAAAEGVPGEGRLLTSLPGGVRSLLDAARGAR